MQNGKSYQFSFLILENIQITLFLFDCNALTWTYLGSTFRFFILTIRITCYYSYMCFIGSKN